MVAPRPLPAFLRIYAILALAAGVLLVIAILAQWSTGGSARWGRALVAGYHAYAGWQVLRRDSDGLDSLLWANYFSGVMVLLVFGMRLYGGEPLHPLLWLLPVWLVFIIWYLRRCRETVDWNEEWDEDWREFAAETRREWAQDPESKLLVAQWFVARERELAAKGGADPTTLVAEMLATDEDDIEASVEDVPPEPVERSVPFLVAGLSAEQFLADPEVVVQLVSLLPVPAPRETAPVLAQCCLKLEGEDRGIPLAALASTGDAAFHPVVLAGLSHEDTAATTAGGLRAAFDAGRKSDVLMNALQPRLVEMLDEPLHSEVAAQVLFAYDTVWASRLVCQNLDLTMVTRIDAVRIAGEVDRQSVVAALAPLWPEALAKQSWAWVAAMIPIVRPDTTVLDGLWSTFVHADGPGLDTHAIGRILVAVLDERVRLGVDVEALLRDVLRDPLVLPPVTERAAELLCAHHGLGEDPLVDYELELGENARFACALRWLDVFTMGDGFVSALYGLNDENFPVIAAAAERVGSIEVARLWRRVLALVASGGHAPESWEDRQELLFEHGEDFASDLVALTAEYESVRHRLRANLALFMVEHRSEMRDVLQREE